MSKHTKRPVMAYVLIAVLLLVAIAYVARPFLKPSAPPAPPVANVPKVTAPDFLADSAFTNIKKQVEFGPRVPNTPAHKKCGEWLVKEFKRYGFSVIEQKVSAPYYKGGTMNGVNIIAQYKPEISKRICLAAHWDSRNEADKDTKDQNKAIDGADDGASGVGVLLEIARTLQQNPVDIGVDLICFDLEDNGNDDGASETWCLGSQYWSKNLHRPGYSPYYAILLDLVGAKGAKFYKEGISREVAPELVDRVWDLANNLGYSQYFIPENRGGITDDHLFVIRNARIPMIDIISLPNDGNSPFGAHHHTHSDDINIIDKNVLKAVGQTMTTLIYRTNAGVF
ncbi:MAG TPA: glutamine cyclotransferase [Saprospirales bacterium]|nr:glutamine cyclotransferase [Saprospirales bacterium]